MQLHAYSIYDNKALQYHPPFFASTHASAVRSFADLANDLNTNVGRHPSDYILYCIGTYDDQRGTMVPLAPLEHICDALAMIKPMPTLFSDNKGAL